MKLVKTLAASALALSLSTAFADIIKITVYNNSGADLNFFYASPQWTNVPASLPNNSVIEFYSPNTPENATRDSYNYDIQFESSDRENWFGITLEPTESGAVGWSDIYKKLNARILDNINEDNKLIGLEVHLTPSKD